MCFFFRLLFVGRLRGFGGWVYVFRIGWVLGWLEDGLGVDVYVIVVVLF